MWFILLFAVCGLAIPIALEIHVRGANNILARSGEDLARSAVGQKLTRATGATVGWANSLLALAVLFLLGWAALQFLSWLLGLVF